VVAADAFTGKAAAAEYTPLVATGCEATKKRLPVGRHSRM
jgi:hypothetical protein